MRFLIVVIIFSFLFIGCIAQKDSLSISKLNKVFRKSILQDSSKKISTLSNPWISDNFDSLYYKSEVIKLTNFKSNKGYNGYCDDVNWTFYRKNKFIIKDCQHCKEPPTCKATKNKDFFEIKINKLESNLILELFNFDKLIERFEIVSLVDSEIKTELILKRVEPN